jgi:hypothetical protein
VQTGCCCNRQSTPCSSEHSTSGAVNEPLCVVHTAAVVHFGRMSIRSHKYLDTGGNGNGCYFLQLFLYHRAEQGSLLRFSKHCSCYMLVHSSKATTAFLTDAFKGKSFHSGILRRGLKTLQTSYVRCSCRQWYDRVLDISYIRKRQYPLSSVLCNEFFMPGTSPWCCWRSTSGRL